MQSFIGALFDPDIAFLRNALLAGLLASVPFGVIGCHVVVRRVSYIAGAVSHSVLGGIGAALYLGGACGWTWLTPMLGATIAALLSAFIIWLVGERAKEREDTVIGAVWAIGMAAGLVFIAKTPGYVNPMSYLFGNILLITRADLWMTGGLAALVVAVCALFHNKFLASGFDAEFASLRGVRSGLYHLLLLCMASLTIVLLVRIVGIVMVIAFLTIPAGTAGFFCRRLAGMMATASLLCALFTVAGLWTSYALDFPSGSTIILAAGVFYLAAAGCRTAFLKLRGRFKGVAGRSEKSS